MMVRPLRSGAVAAAGLISSLECAATAPRRAPAVVAVYPGAAPSASAPISGSGWLHGQARVCGEVRGRVVDRATGRPLRGASVYVDGGREGAATDSAGTFRFRPAGSGFRVILVRAIGYRSAEFAGRVDSAAGPVVEVRLAGAHPHSDGITEVLIGGSWRCRPAT